MHDIDHARAASPGPASVPGAAAHSRALPAWDGALPPWSAVPVAPGAASTPLRLPAPAARQKTAFPAAAVITPLVAAGALWLVTRSPYSLVFAVLSPVTALVSVASGLWRGRHGHAADRARHDRELELLRARVVAAQDAARTRLRAQTPPAAELLARRGDPERWRAHAASVHINLGAGTVPSGVKIDGEARTGREQELCAAAVVLTEAPVSVPAAAGIGICGPPALAWSLARGYLVQLLCRLSPATAVLRAPGSQVPPGLPHDRPASAGVPADVIDLAGAGRDEAPPAGRRAAGQTGTPVPAARGGTAPRGAAESRRIRIVVAARPEGLPPTLGTIVQVTAPGRADILHSDAGPGHQGLAIEHVGRAQLAMLACELHEHAARLGLVAGHAPRRAHAGTTLGTLPESGDAGLRCAVGIYEGGEHERGEHAEPCFLDLVRDGPHAIVGGTTGSGKSELLTTWVASMARSRPPRRVSFLLIDFKGGAAFAPLRALPHCVGVLTDLDEAGARRAVTSLSAELRRRERILAQAGATQISEPACAGLLARLVIVVDEFQAMLQALPELNTVFTDIAARGRSLGIHLILCTQRPSGVVREALMANCGLRVCLRVHAKADSQAVIGDGRAALLPADRPGRCLAGPVGAARPVQVARTAPDEVSRITARHRDAPAAAAPWLEPLPTHISLARLAEQVRQAHGAGRAAQPAGRPAGRPAGEAGPGEGAGLLLGMTDDPAAQRQYPARFDPAGDGCLLILGDAGAGKTALLQTLAEQAGVHILRGSEDCWDAVQDAAEACLRPHGPAAAPGSGAAPGAPAPGVSGRASQTRLLLIDDLDALLARFDEDYAHDFAAALALLLREGSPRVTVVASCRRLAGRLAAMADLFTARLLLKIAERSDFTLAGGPPELHDPHLPPGAGVWRGLRLQAAVAPATPDTTPHAGPVPAPVDFSGGALIVSRSVAGTLERLRQAGVDVIELDQGVPGRGRAGLGFDTGPGSGGRQGVGAGARAADPGGIDLTDGSAARVVIADPETWQSAWSLFDACRAGRPVVFDGCLPADVRLLARVRALPPVLEPYRGHVWVLDTDGRLRRGTLSR